MQIIPIFSINYNRVVGYLISEYLSADEIEDIINTQYGGVYPDTTADEFNKVFPGCVWRSATGVELNTIECEF